MPGPVFIEGDAVDLHTIEEEDLGFLQAAINRPEVWRPIGRDQPINLDQEREFFEDVVASDDSVDLLVCSGGTPVGIIGLDPIEWKHGTAELGYWLDPEHHGQGYGGEAAELVVGHGFGQLRLHRIAARVFDFNEPSRRLLESIGFTHEGTHREAVFIDGDYRDVEWYAILAGEWFDRA